jgi:hypothetical protein
MGWKTAFDYAGRIAARHTTSEPARQDHELPLGARVGGIVKLQRAPFIRAEAAGSLVAMPPQADERIVAVSQLRFALEGRLYRYYLATGDVDDKERFIQVFQDVQGQLEIMYCTQLTRIIAQSAAEQDAFTGERGYGLGDLGYSLWRNQLADIGVSQPDLERVFGTREQLDYVRDAGDRDQAFVAPFHGQEVRIDDPQGMRGLRQELYLMPYVRALAGGASESLLISTEIIESVNGDATRRGIHVDFVVGIPLEPERVTIQ